MDLLRHLAFFAGVAETRHFGEAAQSLGMTQPPLSQGIQRLERHLGVRLFDRDARRVRLTGAGQRLLPAAHELLRLAAEFTESAGYLAKPELVRIGVCADLEEWIPRVLSAVASDGVNVAPYIAGSKALVAGLHDGDLEAAVVRHPGVVDGLVPGDIQLLPTRLVMPPHSPISGLAEVRLPVAVPPRHHQPSAHDQLVDTLRRAGHTGEVTECPDLAQAAALVAIGAAVRVCPAMPGQLTEDTPALRVRVVLPPVRARRQGVDYDKVRETLVAALPS